MPKPVHSGQRYLPGLDGLRAVAVLAVMAYHEQFGWAPGGLLGVGVFFTLSGYLITSLLISQWSRDGRMHLGRFWLGRARRLLPALFVMLAVVTAWVTLVDRARLAGLKGAVAAAATYSSNWYAIVQQQSYFARFAPPGPLDHLWSLAVEEQFYLVWPSLLLLGLFLVRGHGSRGPRRLAAPTLALAAASAIAMAVLYQPGLDPTRVYEGTDTRAFGLLIGAALALATVGRHRAASQLTGQPGTAPQAAAPGSGEQVVTTLPLPKVPPAGQPTAPHSADAPDARHRSSPAAQTTKRVLLDVAGIAGLVGICLMIWRVGQYSPLVYRGGLVLLSIATAAVVAAAASPATLVARALGWRPLRWLGARSYGIYLWHYPVIVLTSPANSAEDVPRAVLQIAASIALAALSWRFIEEPIRHGVIAALWTRLRTGGWRRLLPDGLGGMTALTGASAVLVVACAGLFGSVPAPAGTSPSDELASGAGGQGTSPFISKSVSSAGPHAQFVGGAPASDRQDGRSARSAKGASAAQPGGQSGAQSGRQPGGQQGAQSAAQAARTGPPRTSCQGVAHIGDSTSEGLVSPDYLPNPANRIQARYEDVGVHTVIMNISGGRSVVEVLPGQVNGYDAARQITASGFRGCWVFALGTDDTADVAVGSQVPLATRIRRMMSAAHGQPVMWVNVISLQASGPYAETNMARWNRALLAACARYPNMRIYNWASVARRGWFISDGIHYTSAGYKARARLIADALASAFPLHGHSAGCVVR